MSEVSLELSLWLNVSWSAVTWGRARRGVTFEALSGVPPPWKPKKPFGETVIVVPVVARTLAILAETASRAISMEIDKAIATARIVTTPTVRIVLRKVLRTPRLMEPIATSSATINLLSLTVSDVMRE